MCRRTWREILATDIKEVRAKRAEVAKAVAKMTAAATATDAELKKASAQAEKTRKELSGESDE
jgi:uncharacterized protein involved in exopolysaccharide biosynthesis